MAGISYQRLTIALSVVCAGLLVSYCCLFWCYGWLKIRVALASEQAEVFEEMRAKALQSDAAGAADCLKHIVSSRPSGSRQRTGSRLDRMVEHQRELAVRDIVGYLRGKTGEDLGQGPEAWIQKYSRK
jgi:hypothetical protein